MTELAYPLDELDESQELKRRGGRPAFWSHNKLRRGARIALNGLDSRQRVSTILRQVRNSINAGSVVAEPEESTFQDDPMAVALPPKDKLQRLGASACELPIDPFKTGA